MKKIIEDLSVVTWVNITPVTLEIAKIPEASPDNFEFIDLSGERTRCEALVGRLDGRKSALALLPLLDAINISELLGDLGHTSQDSDCG